MKINPSNSVFQNARVRFTVIHPNCIRIEESVDGSFVDEPSLFAVRREARGSASLEQQGRDLCIDTGHIRLVYRSDGKPLSAANLHADIRDGNRRVTWRPGQANRANLGGTAETLDGWTGARPLPEGLLSRDGWHVVDDSGRSLLVTEREDAARSRPGGTRAATTPEWVRARRQPGKDWYLFGYGRDFRAAFQALAAISGPVPMPRRYTLGALKPFTNTPTPISKKTAWISGGWTGSSIATPGGFRV